MKKVKLNNKLQVNKETIAKLNDVQLNNIKGGATFSLWSCEATTKPKSCCLGCTR